MYLCSGSWDKAAAPCEAKTAPVKGVTTYIKGIYFNPVE